MATNALEFLKGPPSEFAPIYLIGPGKPPRAKAATFEPLLAERVVEAIVDAGIEPGARDMALASFYADETDPQSVVVEAQTLPFLTDRRVVVVRNAERYLTAAAGDVLQPYLDAPADTTVLILLMNTVDKRTKLYKACEKNGAIVECPALRPNEAKDWLRAEAKARGRRIAAGAVNELIDRAGARLSDVNNALTLVINYLGEEGAPITEQSVREACSDVAEEEIWSLTDGIAASQPGAALTSLRRLLDLGQHPDSILGSINWLLKNAYLIATSDGPPPISRFVADKVRPLATRFGARTLIRAFALCTDTQFAMRNTGVDGPIALELLVLKLASAGRKAA